MIAGRSINHRLIKIKAQVALRAGPSLSGTFRAGPRNPLWSGFLAGAETEMQIRHAKGPADGRWLVVVVVVVIGLGGKRQSGGGKQTVSGRNFIFSPSALRDHSSGRGRAHRSYPPAAARRIASSDFRLPPAGGRVKSHLSRLVSIGGPVAR